MRGLASIGVIRVVHGRGEIVNRISPDSLTELESLFFVLERDTLLHAIEVRRILEVEAIALAAERAQPEDLAEIECALLVVERSLASGENPLGQRRQR